MFFSKKFKYTLPLTYLMSLLKLFNRKPAIKDISFFIDIARSLNEKNDKCALRNEIYKGIARNPNVSREQIESIVKNMNGYEKAEIFGGYAFSHPDKGSLTWLWNFMLAQKDEKTLFNAYLISFYILDRLDEKDKLYSEIIDYFMALKGKKWNSPAYGMIPYQEYGGIVEYLMKNEKDLDKLNNWISLHREYIEQGDYKSGHFKDWTEKRRKEYYFDYRVTNRIAFNKNLDDKWVKMLFKKAIKLSLEEEKAAIVAALLSCQNISKKLFQEIFDYRNKIKITQKISDMYESAARNEKYIHTVFKELYPKLKKGFSSDARSSSNYKIFLSFLSNRSLSTEEIESLLVIIKNQLSEKVNTHHDFFRSFTWIIQKFLERKELTKDQIMRLCKVYLGYLDKLNEGDIEFMKKTHFFCEPSADILSKVEIDGTLFDFVWKKMEKNVFKTQVFGSMLANDSLTLQQYQMVASVLDPTYFKNSHINVVYDYYQKDPIDPAFVLKNWASCKHVK